MGKHPAEKPVSEKITCRSVSVKLSLIMLISLCLCYVYSRGKLDCIFDYKFSLMSVCQYGLTCIPSCKLCTYLGSKEKVRWPTI